MLETEGFFLGRLNLFLVLIFLVGFSILIASYCIQQYIVELFEFFSRNGGAFETIGRFDDFQKTFSLFVG